MAAKCSPSSPGSPPLSPSREQLSGPEEGVSFSGKFHLPPGFRFHPTDQELVLYYLRRKVCGLKIEFDVIAEINLYEFEPWDLPEISCLQTRDLEWYFFSPIDKKYPNGGRTNRSTHAGYWKATGKDRPITSGSRIVGMKKTLVFYKGRAPKGERTDWVMREYRLTDLECERIRAQQNTFVVCRVFKKSGPGPRNGEQYGAPVEDEEWESLETEGDGHDRMGAHPPSNTNSGDKDFRCGESLGETGSTCMNDLPSLEASCSQRVCSDSNAQLQYVKGETMKIVKYEVKNLVGADYLDLASSSIEHLATRTLQVPSCSESDLENESDLLESNSVFTTHDEEGPWDCMLELAGRDQSSDRLSNLTDMRYSNLCAYSRFAELKSCMDAIKLAGSRLWAFGKQFREQKKLFKVLHILFGSRLYPNIKVQDSVLLCLIKRAVVCSSEAIRCPEVCLLPKQPEVLEDTVLKAFQQVGFDEAIQSTHPPTTNSSLQYPVIYHSIPNADPLFQGGNRLEKTSHSKHARSFTCVTVGSDGVKEFLLVLGLIWHLTTVLGALATVLSTISEQPEHRNKDLESVEILETDVGDVHSLPVDTPAESFGKKAFTCVTCDHVFSSCMRFSVVEEEMLLHPLLYPDRQLKLVVFSS